MTPTLVLLRHGESLWNAADRFAGWVDVALTDRGREQARSAGRLIAERGLPPRIIHCSVLERASETAELANEAGGFDATIVHDPRLNERHYGALQGMSRSAALAEFGEERFASWRRSFDAEPPPIAADSPYSQAHDPRYGPSAAPRTESLRTVHDRVVPYFRSVLLAELLRDGTILVVSHGNTLRALLRHLYELDDEALRRLELPTGTPMTVPVDDTGKAVGRAHFLVDPHAEST